MPADWGLCGPDVEVKGDCEAWGHMWLRPTDQLVEALSDVGGRPELSGVDSQVSQLGPPLCQ